MCFKDRGGVHVLKTGMVYMCFTVVYMCFKDSGFVHVF